MWMDRLRENPLIAIGTIAGTFVTLWGAFQLSDSLVMTHAEHDVDMVEVAGLQQFSECARFERLLERAKRARDRLKRQDASQEDIDQAQRRVDSRERQFIDNLCATVLK